MTNITIDDNIDGFLSFDLRDILTLIPNANSFSWVLKDMDFNILAPSLKDDNIAKLDNLLLDRIMECEEYSIQFDDLLKISKYNIQTLNGRVIGNASNNQKIIISIFDSSYWTIQTNLIPFLENLKNHFKSWKIKNR